jgi:uncharacterized protein
MLGRILLAIVVVALVLWLLRRALAATRRPEGPKAPDAARGDLVACAHCGVNLPRSEARSAGGRHYCSEEHWRLGPRDR